MTRRSLLRPPWAFLRLVPLAILLVPLAAAPARATDGDPLAEAQAAYDLGNALLDAGLARQDPVRIRNALNQLIDAEALYRARLEAPYPPLTSGQRRRAERQLAEVGDLVAFCREYLRLGGSVAPAPAPEPDDLEPGPACEPEPEPDEPPVVECPGSESTTRWARRVFGEYEETPAASDRAALARALAREAGLVALPYLGRMFDDEASPEAREGVHAALAEVGTSRVAGRMARYARTSTSDRRRDALDVIYRCLEKPECEERERPFVRAVRAFHRLGDLDLSMEILGRLDAMGTEGVAALGQVLYVDDFGCHDRAISLLAEKRDARAVPPLVHKMNRFKFDRREQIPAHEALLKLGWYAVPALIDRLDDKAAGIWISWTLRKITKETFGTQKRKWHEWWKQERNRHPELLASVPHRTEPDE